MGRSTFLIQIKGHKHTRKKQTFPGVISVSSQNAQVNTTVALDCDQVPWRTIHGKQCFTIMIFRHVHISTYLMNAIKTDNAGCYHCAFLLLSLPSLE